MSTYPRRPKVEALSNTVDVVERLRDPTDQVPNARHLRDDDDDDVTGAGLRLSTTMI